MVAVLVTFASVIATPTPTFAVPPPVAEPLAIDDASADSLDCSVSAPPMVTVVPMPMRAMLDAFASVMATAAPTLIEPELVDALGVPPAAPEVFAPFADAELSA